MLTCRAAEAEEALTNQANEMRASQLNTIQGHSNVCKVFYLYKQMLNYAQQDNGSRKMSAGSVCTWRI